MPIVPLPQFEADLAEDRKAYEALPTPKSLVVRFGKMKLVGEFPYDGSIKPGCGTKLVIRSHRGTELASMLTSTCANGGCNNTITRKEMLQYIENSGGRDYPFFTEGKILRVATVEDLNRESAMEAETRALIQRAREVVDHLGLRMKVVDAEQLLGGERIIFHFTTENEERVDFRPAVMELAAIYRARIDMHQVGPRDEARLTADYERCGQHCCCKQFLKVLKPVAMKQAKIQKATLDPLKISGRCGRLMCCLRYEENTYDELKKNLPRKKTPIQTPDGPGIVIDTQILTQLVLVRLDATNEDAAYPVESLSKLTAPPPGARPAGDEDDDDAPPGAAGPQGGQRPPQGPGPRPGPGVQAGQGGQGPRNDRGGPPRQGGPGGGGGGPGGGQQRGPGRGPGGPGGNQVGQGGQRQGPPQGQRGPGGPGVPPQGQPPAPRDLDRERASKLIPPSQFREDNGPPIQPPSA